MKDEPNQYRLRFVGRFVFACEGEKGMGPYTQVTALGMDMAKYEKKGACHQLLLTVQRTAVQPSEENLADWTVFGVAKPGGVADQIGVDDRLGIDDQLLLWNIDGCDLSVDAERGPIALGFNEVPDLSELARNAAFHPQNWLRTQSPARMTFTLQGGTIDAKHLELPPRGVAFKQVGERPPGKRPMDKTVPDVVEATVTASGPLTITLKSKGRSDRLIHVPARDGAGPVITLSNLCTAPGSDVDEEFAAYYDVLGEMAPEQLERMIPYTLPDAQTEGRHADCVYVAAVYYRAPAPAG